MQRTTTIFLQILVVLVGIATLTLLIWEPQVEGVNIGATNFEIYFQDPFLAIAYTVSIAFFVALYQVFTLLGRVRDGKWYSPGSARALQIIRYCGLVLVAFALAGEAYLLVVRPGDDIAGGVFVGLILIAISSTIAATATRFAKQVRSRLAQ